MKYEQFETLLNSIRGSTSQARGVSSSDVRMSFDNQLKLNIYTDQNVQRTARRHGKNTAFKIIH